MSQLCARALAPSPQDDFTLLMFEVAEMWLSNSTDPREYIEFFTMVIEKATRAVTTAPFGVGSAKADAGGRREWTSRWARTPRSTNPIAPDDADHD